MLRPAFQLSRFYNLIYFLTRPFFKHLFRTQPHTFTHLCSNMVATDSKLNDYEKIIKLPENKSEWFLGYKRKLFTQASALQVLEILQGLDIKPVMPDENDFAVIRYYDNKLTQWKTKFARARKLLFDITEGTSKAALLQQFETNNGESIDIVGAWSAIVAYYEKDVGTIDQRHNLELQLDLLTSDLTDPILRFKDLQTRLETISISLRNLPEPQDLVLDGYTKKSKLFAALARDSVLSYIIENDAVHVDTYGEFLVQVERLIAVKQTVKLHTIADSRTNHSKTESSSSTAAFLTTPNSSIDLNSDIDTDKLKDLNASEANALKALVNKNLRKLSSLNRSLYSSQSNNNSTQRPTQSDSSNAPNSQHQPSNDRDNSNNMNNSNSNYPNHPSIFLIINAVVQSCTYILI